MYTLKTCYGVHMNIRQFRANMRQAFDSASEGTPVTIERNNTVYTLVVGTQASTPVVYTPKHGEMPPIAQAVNQAANDAELPLCRNGHLLTPRGKCLQKGCKYA